MRATILSFDGHEGIVSYQGTQYPFSISAWKSDQPPKPGQTVECELDGEQILSVTAVDVQKIAQEKAVVYLGKAQQIGKATYQSAGPGITTAYGVFALLALFADMVRDVPVTLPGLVNGLSWTTLEYSSGANGGMGFLLVLVAILSIAVPVFWNRPQAQLAYFLPLIIMVIGAYNLFSAISSLSGFVGAFDRHLADRVQNQAFSLITLWFWITFGVSIYLAVVGYRRFRRALSA
jgi:positive regulator of sigma E activity